MNHFTSRPWAYDFVLAAQINRAGTRSAFYREVHSGKFHRVAHGVYLPMAVWNELSGDARFLARIHAAAMRSENDLVLSHMSAASLWLLPAVNPWPARVEAMVGPAPGGRSRRGFIAHADGIPAELDRIDGLCVTTLARTVVDVARTGLFGTAVAMADRALAEKNIWARGPAAASVTHAELATAFDSHPSSRGASKCGRVLEIASGLSESPGESISRVGMFLLGLPMPILQQEFVDDQGRMYADFWWPEFNLVGEFDGKAKYVKPELLRGMTTEQALLKEKDREDRIRALGPRFSRWGWEVATSLPRLEAKLRGAGLR